MMSKYYEDVNRCNIIGDYLKKKLKRFHLSREEIFRRFALEIGVKITTSHAIINTYLNGGFPQGISSDIKNNCDRISHLERLSILCKLLEIPESDSIIQLVKEVNQQFHYPLERKYLDKKNCSCTINVEFSYEDLSLKPKQLKHLERIALNYAIKNIRNS